VSGNDLVRIEGETEGQKKGKERKRKEKKGKERESGEQMKACSEKGWNEKGDAVLVVVLWFGDKGRDIFVMVIAIGMIVISVLIGYESRPCYGQKSVAFLHAAIHTGYNFTIVNDFIESHAFEDAFHVG
jgi:hypothetical protein